MLEFKRIVYMKAMRKFRLQRMRVKLSLHEKKTGTGCACKRQLSDVQKAEIKKKKIKVSVLSREGCEAKRRNTRFIHINTEHWNLLGKEQTENMTPTNAQGDRGRKTFDRLREREKGRSETQNNEADKVLERASRGKWHSWSKGGFFLVWWINCTEKIIIGDNDIVSQK